MAFEKNKEMEKALEWARREYCIGDEIPEGITEYQAAAIAQVTEEHRIDEAMMKDEMDRDGRV